MPSPAYMLYGGVYHVQRGFAGELLPAFLLGSVATVASTFLALAIFPLSSLGENGWKIAAALCARHIGGAINFVAVAAVTGIDGVMVSAALAADNLICALYFASLYALARRIPPDAGQKGGLGLSNSGEEVCFHILPVCARIISSSSTFSAVCASTNIVAYAYTQMLKLLHIVRIHHVPV